MVFEIKAIVRFALLGTLLFFSASGFSKVARRICAPSFEQVNDYSHTSHLYDSLAWEALKSPITKDRPHGILAIRREAEENGVFQVVEGKRPNDPTLLRAKERLYGTSLLFAGDVAENSSPQEVPGVALHPGPAYELGNSYRGTLNPSLGYRRLHGSLGEKGIEGLSGQSLNPEMVIPTKETYSLQKRWSNANGRSLRDEARHLSAGSLKENEVAQFLEDVVEAAQNEFSGDVIFKIKDEFQTGDKGALLIPSKEKMPVWLSKFYEAVNAFKAENKTTDLSDANAEEFISSHSREAAFLWRLIYKPTRLIVQPKLKLRKTPLGYMDEFRIDFKDSEAVRIVPRYGYEYRPEAQKIALAFAEKFLSDMKTNPKSPGSKYLSGGMDIAFQEDGKPVIVEFNYGEESAMIQADIEPVYANMYLTALLGKPTPMIADFENAYQKGIRSEVNFLKRSREYFEALTVDAELVEEARTDTFFWLRNRHLDALGKNPSAEEVRKTREALQTLARALPENQKRKEVLQSGLAFLDTLP